MLNPQKKKKKKKERKKKKIREKISSNLYYNVKLKLLFTFG